jgi:DNA-binding transcriptional MerR regulator
MSHGFKTVCALPNNCYRGSTVARQLHISAELLREYEREGVLIPLKSPSGMSYFTKRDYVWIEAIGRLLHEAHLTFDDLRHALAECPCWNVRHCGFHSKKQCPLISDLSKPCWVNRAMCPGQCSCSCYLCAVYRSAPTCESLAELLRSRAS